VTQYRLPGWLRVLRVVSFINSKMMRVCVIAYSREREVVYTYIILHNMYNVHAISLHHVHAPPGGGEGVVVCRCNALYIYYIICITHSPSQRQVNTPNKFVGGGIVCVMQWCVWCFTPINLLGV